MAERDDFEAAYVADAHKAGFTTMTVEEVAELREGDHYGAHRHMLNGKWEGWQWHAALAAPAVVVSAEPVAWQERQMSRDGWTRWYSTTYEGGGESEAHGEILGGVSYEFRPLYATPVGPDAVDADAVMRTLPKLPEVGYLGDDASYGYDAYDMRTFATEAVLAALASTRPSKGAA